MHLSHRDIQEFIENRQTPKKQAIQRHLEECPECQAIANEYRLLQKHLKRVDPYDVPETFVYDVTRALPDLEHKSSPLIEWTLLSLMAGLIVGIFSFIRFDFQRVRILLSDSVLEFLFTGNFLSGNIHRIGLISAFLVLFWILNKVLIEKNLSAGNG
jgi:hypothetical protein